MDPKKEFSSEVFDSIIVEFKKRLVNAQFREKKNQKTLKQKEPNRWSKSKRFLEKLCNMESKVQR